jgi:transposase
LHDPGVLDDGRPAVAQNFIECDRDQELLLPPSLREWLPDDHLAWFVIDAVAEMELAAFYAAYREDGWGRAAFDPQMMVTLLLYAYAIGERSARKIERRCRDDVAFRVICANRVPDHVTIARFRARHEDALAETFTQVLALCAQAGLVSVGLVALDGTLVHGNAAKTANRSYASIRDEVDEILGEARATDEREDAQLGERRGDELPAELADPRSRRARLKRCKEELEHEHKAAEQAHADNLAWRAAWEHEHGRKLGGRKPAPPDRAALERRMINTSDPDSRAMKRAGRSLQGYNVQVIADEAQLVVAAEVTQAHNDSDQLEAMVAGARRELEAAGASQSIGTVLADGGYWNSAQIAAVRSSGTDVVVPSKDRKRAKPRRYAPPQGPEAERAEALLSTPEGKALYRRRQQLVEPIFADVKFNRRADRFLRRGLSACNSEWRLIAATHNLLKLWRAGLAANGTGMLIAMAA